MFLLEWLLEIFFGFIFEGFIQLICWPLEKLSDYLSDRT
jgi:hypothetical protein